MDINLWEFLFLIFMMYLPFIIAITITFAILTLLFWYKKAFRFLLLMTILCALPLLYLCGYKVYDGMESWKSERKYSRRIIKLKDTLTIADIHLPSGSKIFLQYDAIIPESPREITFGSIDMIVFAKPTRVGQFILRDTFIYSHDMYNSWQGTLEGTQDIKGWPAWGVFIGADNEQQLQLSQNIERWGLTFITGTTVKIRPSSWEFSLPGGRTFTVYESTDGVFKSEGDSTEKLNEL
ncbi:hypothetical protein SAMN04488121_111148 [Chitinophaga filiformis]|uniref:Uncharacterized protein n=2 Tax=Chitinophaga filiformis TaxID=104663 RepID=A0A1G8BSV3_CHIFI|nr:hypothetical protein SAMN04488121_111148 [Chitinophaga filiformis]